MMYGKHKAKSADHEAGLKRKTIHPLLQLYLLHYQPT